MTSQGDGSAGQPPNVDSLPSLDVRRTRPSATDEPSETSIAASLPSFRSSSPSLLASRSSTLSGILSRSSSPNGRSPLSLARLGRSSTASPLSSVADGNDETRTLITRAFSPVVGVLASAEIDELVRAKGLPYSFAELVKPYGERIIGKVVVRDSVGASRAWEDYGIRFVDLKETIEGTQTQAAETLEKLEDLVEQYLEQHTGDSTGHGHYDISPYYKLYLSRLLSSQPSSQHETFMHPVATVIAIGSSTPSPIETLRNLYSQTAQGAFATPPYASPEYLRYYVLVHDDDKDDLAKSSSLFDQMKRHFGLHCHLLRLRSIPCPDDSEEVEEVPHQDWLSASADLSKLQATTQLVELENDFQPRIFATDAASLRAFTRELVSQSIIPYMEQRISFWNEQIASRRRGLSGRFMSLSKRWGGIGGLGGSRNTSATTSSPASSSGSNYDSLQGYYRWDTSEAQLRKMADFATMLRDYKLAASTYDLLRSDYSNDKAWKYLAGANEMCSISNLLNPLLSSSSTNSSSGKTLPKLETFDTMLEAASYSYLTRCNEPVLALRCILLTVELLKVRGRLPSELASKWAVRALELNLAAHGTNCHVLISERVASCYAGNRNSAPYNNNTTPGVSSILSNRTRHAALWSLTSAEEWMKLGRAPFAASRLDEAQELYAELRHNDSAMSGFREMSGFMHDLSLTVRMKLGQARKRGISGASATGGLVEPDKAGDPLGVTVGRGDDVEEQMEVLVKKPSAGHRRGLSVNTVNEVQAKGGMSPVRQRKDPLDPLSEGIVDDGFE